MDKDKLAAGTVVVAFLAAVVIVALDGPSWAIWILGAATAAFNLGLRMGVKK